MNITDFNPELFWLSHRKPRQAVSDRHILAVIKLMVALRADNQRTHHMKMSFPFAASEVQRIIHLSDEPAYPGILLFLFITKNSRCYNRWGDEEETSNLVKYPLDDTPPLIY